MTIKEAVRGRLTCWNVDRAMNVILQTTENEPPKAFHCMLLDWMGNGVFPSATFSLTVAEGPAVYSQGLSAKGRFSHLWRGGALQRSGETGCNLTLFISGSVPIWWLCLGKASENAHPKPSETALGLAFAAAGELPAACAAGAPSTTLRTAARTARPAELPSAKHVGELVNKSIRLHYPIVQPAEEELCCLCLDWKSNK